MSPSPRLPPSVLLFLALGCAGPQKPASPPLNEALFEEGRQHLVARRWREASDAFARFARACPTMVEDRCAQALLLRGQAEAELGKFGQAIMTTMSLLRRSHDNAVREPARGQLARLRERAEAWWRQAPADSQLEIVFDSGGQGSTPRTLALTIDARPIAVPEPQPDASVTLFAAPAPAGAHAVEVSVEWATPAGTNGSITRLVQLRPAQAIVLSVRPSGRSGALEVEEATVHR